MKQSRSGRVTAVSALLDRWKTVLPMAIVVVVLYVEGYTHALSRAGFKTFLLIDLNPLPWFLSIAALGYYFRKRDEYKAAGREIGAWSTWRVGSFVAGVLMAMALWESPINALVPRSMALYTFKLMGEFELAAPLVFFGIPFELIDQKGLQGPLWSVLRFLHKPVISGAALLVILALWDMSDQMAWGLHSAFGFLVLPGIYLGLGIIVWMQSMHAFSLWPNLSSHLKKGIYVWAMELAMMVMGSLWFWSAMNMGPVHSHDRVWGLTTLGDVHLAGIFMTALSLPTMCLVIWHFWQWVEDNLRVPGAGDEYAGSAVPRQET